MLSCHYSKFFSFTKRKFDGITTLAATRRSLSSRYRFCHASFPSFPSAASQPVSVIKPHCRQSDLLLSRTRPFRWSSLRVRSYSTTTDIPTASDDFDALVYELSHSESWDPTSTSLHSSGGLWLEGDCCEPMPGHALRTRLSRSGNRFDWRPRASSRIRKKDEEVNTEARKTLHRKRLQDLEPDLTGPFYQAFQDYKTRFVHHHII